MSKINKNPYLKSANELVEYTVENVRELQKCTQDAEYFIDTYCQIQSATEGSIPFKLHPYQRRIVNTFANNRLSIALAPRQIGKCEHYDSIVTIRQTPAGINKLVWYVVKIIEQLTKSQKVIDNCSMIFKQTIIKLEKWCWKERDITVGQLFNISNPTSCRISDPNGNLKFIEQCSPSSLFVKTPTGFSSVQYVSKTVPYDVWQLQTQNHTLLCADRHIVMDNNNAERTVESLSSIDYIQTDTGNERVISVTKLDIDAENMYDLTLNDEYHVYYTNGIVSHNSWIAGAYLLWFAMFHFEKTILILSNKNDNAMEMIHRVRFIYERLPKWLKAGLADDGWNKHTVGFDNGSRIISQATSENSARGLAVSLLFCLGEQTNVTVRDRETGEIKQIQMNELYQELEEVITT